MDYSLDKVIIITFYEDMKDGDGNLVWYADKEYKVTSIFNDAYILPCELDGDYNYGVSPKDAGIKFDVRRVR